MARPRKTLGPGRPVSNSIKRAWFWKNGIWRAIFFAANSDLPRTVLSNAQFDVISVSYPLKVENRQDIKDHLERAFGHALALPNFYEKMHLRKVDLKKIREAKAHADALIQLFDSRANFHWFLMECADVHDLSCTSLVEDLQVIRELIDVACNLLPRRQSESLPQMQRRLLTKGLATVWWMVTDTEATRSMKAGRFGDNLICILRVLSEFGDKFNFLGDLNLENTRIEIARRMLEDIDRTKARGMF